MLLKTILVSALCALAVSAQAAVLHTSPLSGGAAEPLGVPDTTTYGQVFTAPLDGNTRLDSFSFWTSGTLLQAWGGLAAWTGTGAGPALFASSAFKTNFRNATEITVDTGGVDLVAGRQYVVYFSTAGIAGNAGANSLAYGAGGGVYNGVAWDNGFGDSPNHEDWIGAQNYEGRAFAGTLAFSAPPAVVPEPGSLMLLGLGAVAFAGGRRRKTA